MKRVRIIAPLIALIAMTGLVTSPCRAQSAAEPFAPLPRQEIRGAQIGWYVNDTLEAFIHAVENTKALIIVFGDKSSSHTQTMGQRVAACPQLNRLAGTAVFAFASPNVDEYARRMAALLRLTDYPTISVIYPRTDVLTEVHRMEGFFDAETIADTMHSALRRANLWPAGMPAPSRRWMLPVPAGMACTPEDARSFVPGN